MIKYCVKSNFHARKDLRALMHLLNQSLLFKNNLSAGIICFGLPGIL
ncbi:MAG: hypothetical protein ACI9GZ_002527 [Bacteroidia bacterium]|jgi:hypothetical protein